MPPQNSSGGGLAERFKATVSKTVLPFGRHRFESCTLRTGVCALPFLRTRSGMHDEGMTMTIAICGSMTFHKQMREAKAALEKAGHSVLVPKSIDLMDTGGYKVPEDEGERIEHKIEYDFIREHFKKIEASDAVLILNYDKKGIRNYIGGNTFLEMGLAFFLKKKIYLLNPVPDMDYLTEMHAMQPKVLHGDLTLIV